MRGAPGPTACWRMRTSPGPGLWRSNSRRGRVQTVPTPGGPAFVQSFYEWPADGPPRLAGVAVVHRHQRLADGHPGAQLPVAQALVVGGAEDHVGVFRGTIIRSGNQVVGETRIYRWTYESNGATRDLGDALGEHVARAARGESGKGDEVFGWTR